MKVGQPLWYDQTTHGKKGFEIGRPLERSIFCSFSLVFKAKHMGHFNTTVA